MNEELMNEELMNEGTSRRAGRTGGVLSPVASSTFATRHEKLEASNAMIQLSGAGKRFGHKLLFENLNWLITAKDRAGLVGANGTGKTTLLKTLAGMESLEYGSLSVTRGTSPDTCRRTAFRSPAAACSPSACRCSLLSATWSRRWKT